MLTERESLQDAICKPLGLAPSPAQLGLLLGYLDLLQRWNATYNLTAVRDRAGMLSQHLADCLAVVPPLARHLQARGLATARVLDVGSGGGLPGLVLAIMLPQLRVTCVDTVGKKAAFVRQAAGALALRVESEHVRVEDLQAQPFQVITSRAFSSLLAFTRLTERHLADDGVWLAMKGKLPDTEMQALPADLRVFHVEHLSVPALEAERCLVWMDHKRQKEVL